MDDDTERVDPTIGRRIRAARVWRGMDQQVLAGLAGYSQGYLSKIERGLVPVDKRATVEAFARALEVSPGDLTGAGTFLMAGGSDENAALVPLRLALADVEFGEELDGPIAPWPEIKQDLAALDAMRVLADYRQLTALLPSLVRNLHASTSGPQRHEALIGLSECYTAARAAAKNLGAPDLAQVAARHLRDVTNHLDGLEWEGLAAWGRANAISSSARSRSYVIAAKAADQLTPGLDQPAVVEMYGMLHLAAALASTVTSNFSQADAHLREAEEAAARPGVGSINFGRQAFGAGNVAMWRTTLAVESGEGGRAVEIASRIDPASMPPSRSRRADWHIDVGRGLAMERRDEEALVEFRAARRIAPQLAHASPWLRETVTNMYERARGDDLRRDLRGFAYWLGIGRAA
jgi:transcriptional regulator with XRE-family HTH domain